MDIMEFLEANYIWMIVVAVILVMTIIGFIADKHGFGKKESKKQNKIEMPIQSNENIKVEESITEPTNHKQVYGDENPLDSFEMPTDSTTNFEDKFMTTVEPVKEEINLQEELATTLNDMDDSFIKEKEEPPAPKHGPKDKSKVETVKELSDEDVELPSIDTLNEEIAEVQEDEDVWKF